MNKNIIFKIVLVGSLGFFDLQASQSDDLQSLISHENALSASRSELRNDEEVLGITAHTSSESLSDHSSFSPSCSYSRNTYDSDKEYRNSPMVNSAFYSIATTNSAQVNAAIAKKVITSSPSLDTANLLADAMIVAARNHSPFVKNSQNVLRNGSSSRKLINLTQDGLQVFHKLPSRESDSYIERLAKDVRGLELLNAYHQKEGLLSDKKDLLKNLCNQREFIETCAIAKESLNR